MGFASFFGGFGDGGVAGGGVDLILLIESHLHNLYFYVKFSLQFARGLCFPRIYLVGGVEFSIWGEERGFSIPFFWEHGEIPLPSCSFTRASTFFWQQILFFFQLVLRG
jgi:hypothetical protein